MKKNNVFFRINRHRMIAIVRFSACFLCLFATSGYLSQNVNGHLLMYFFNEFNPIAKNDLVNTEPTELTGIYAPIVEQTELDASIIAQIDELFNDAVLIPGTLITQKDSDISSVSTNVTTTANGDVLLSILSDSVCISFSIITGDGLSSYLPYSQRYDYESNSVIMQTLLCSDGSCMTTFASGDYSYWISTTGLSCEEHILFVQSLTYLTAPGEN